jgi:hypothetical protein
LDENKTTLLLNSKGESLGIKAKFATKLKDLFKKLSCFFSTFTILSEQQLSCILSKAQQESEIVLQGSSTKEFNATEAIESLQ